MTSPPGPSDRSAVLDLSAIRPDLARVIDLRRTDGPEAVDPPRDAKGQGHAAVGVLLNIASLIFLFITGLVSLVSWPFDVVVGLVTGRRGLVTGLATLQWPSSRV